MWEQNILGDRCCHLHVCIYAPVVEITRWRAQILDAVNARLLNYFEVIQHDW